MALISIGVVRRGGEARTIQTPTGGSLMRALVDAGFDDELLAICGGCCSCATCHVYVEEAFLSRMPPMGADEDGLLDGLDSRLPGSRLSCQVELNGGMDGLSVTIAPDM